MSGPLLVSTTADRLVVGPDRRPGPAGLSLVYLLDGAAVLAVDTAAPDTLVSLSLPRPLDDPARRLTHLVLGTLDAERLIRWSEETEPGAAQDAAPTRLLTPDTGGADRPLTITPGPLPLLGRLALGLEELVRPGPTDAAMALGLVDLGVLATDLAPGLAPDPPGRVLAEAGIDRWELLDPDGWDDAGEELLAATSRRAAHWHKSLHGAAPDLAGSTRCSGADPGRLATSPAAFRPGAASCACPQRPHRCRDWTRLPRPPLRPREDRRAPGGRPRPRRR